MGHEKELSMHAEYTEYLRPFPQRLLRSNLKYGFVFETSNLVMVRMCHK